jgi:hypothetical protein
MQTKPNVPRKGQISIFVGFMIVFAVWSKSVLFKRDADNRDAEAGVEFATQLRSRFSSNHVKSQSHPRSQTAKWNSISSIAVRTAVVLLLLVAVAALSTLAKDIQYFPKINPAHYVSASTKMKVAHPPAVVSEDRVHRVASAKVTLSPPPVWFSLQQFRAEPVRNIGITLSMQHRFPPSLA